MPQLGPLEILVIFVVALLVFGPSKLPEIGRQVGRGVNEFRRFQQSLRRDLDGMLGDDEAEDQTEAARPAPTLPPRELSAETGDPMLPLPWPDSPPPPPPPPDDAPPTDRT
ncbi:MAG TPA: twin-arginine translocase TatA/TatE family subunit [Acidimicrobiia bacterium]|nr:twin-arginine translocase TatA/TatE family subunit [Acidimicrobiia bacterium]